ncbi:MAG: hypothetical protein ACTHN5_12930 [Phycisphaerae bacterium]
MTVLNITSRTDDSGEVRLKIGVPNSDVNITVEIPDVPLKPKSKEEWEAFVKRTAGCIKDPAFRRYPQGDYPVRESRK